MTTTHPQAHELPRRSLLRTALLANAAFSMICGVGLLLFARPLAAAIGGVTPMVLTAVGAGLVLFAADVAHNGWRRPSRQRAQLTVIADAAWVVASVVLLGWRPIALSPLGVWLIADVALVVAVFAVLQQIGIAKVRR